MKNDYTLSEDGKTITIWMRRRTGDRIACLVDASDLEKLQSLDIRWYANWDSRARNFYVVGSLKENREWIRISMHRFLVDAPKGLEVDHIHHNPLDNRRCNLEIKTHQANGMNRKGATRINKTGHRGISHQSKSKKFRLRVTINGKKTYIGQFSTIEDALIARKQFPEYE